MVPSCPEILLLMAVSQQHHSAFFSNTQELCISFSLRRRAVYGTRIAGNAG
jgi:hypothetical protein